MPTVPKWIANNLERVFRSQFHPVIVVETEYLDKQLKKVRFEGDLSNTSFKPGNVIEFRVSETAFRHYTPSFFDKDKGVCEVIFYLHGLGVGSDWANELQKGDNVKLMGPGGKMSLQKDQRNHFFFGDESSLGMVNFLKNEVEKQGKAYRCILELDVDHQSWPTLFNLKTKVVNPSFVYPAKEAIEALKILNDAEWEQWQQASFYLTGRAKSIQQFRKILKAKGVSSKKIHTEPYWGDNKKGL
ncbi:MAG: siderophore-interacting protein [Bacteroidota bacterium]